MKFIKLLFVSTFMMFASAVYAEPAEVLIIDEFEFVCIDATFSAALGIARLHRVATNSRNGNIIYSITGYCFGELPEDALFWNNVNTGAICTADAVFFEMTVSPHGNTKLKCQNFPFD